MKKRAYPLQMLSGLLGAFLLCTPAFAAENARRFDASYSQQAAAEAAADQADVAMRAVDSATEASTYDDADGVTERLRQAGVDAAEMDDSRDAASAAVEAAAIAAGTAPVWYMLGISWLWLLSPMIFGLFCFRMYRFFSAISASAAARTAREWRQSQQGADNSSGLAPEPAMSFDARVALRMKELALEKDTPPADGSNRSGGFGRKPD
jgi:hypothetical protein